MNNQLIQNIFILSVLELLLLGLILITNHFGFALIFSEYIFILIILGTVFYILRLSK